MTDTDTVITAPALAGEVEATYPRFSKWLRQQRASGHPLLAEFPARSPFRFSRQQADQLAAEFIASEVVGHVSDSTVQRRAEEIIRGLLADQIGVSLAPRVISLAAGAPVHIDAASEDGRVLAEIFARQGPLKGGQQKKVAIDVLKLITVQREHPVERLILCFADREASAYATGGGWVAQALRTWRVDVEVVEIPAGLRAEILAAQAGQTMVNPVSD